MWTFAGILVVALAALGLGRLIRAAGLPAGTLIGGVIAGTLLGPSVFGRVDPHLFATVFIGASEQQAQLNGLLALQQEAIANPQITSPAVEQIAEARAAFDAARWSHELPARCTQCLLVLLLVLLGTSAHTSDKPRQPGWLAPISIGLWAALLPAGIACMLLRSVLAFDDGAALFAAAALAIGPWLVPRSDLAAADDAEIGGALLLRRAAMIATLIALAAVTLAMLQSNDAARIAWLAPLALVPLIALVPRALAVDAEQLARHWIMPILAALLMLHVDLLEAFAFWPVLIVFLLSGDGRWVGALLGAMLPGGRTTLRTMRLVMPAMAAGPAQLSIAVLGAAVWIIPQQLTFALLIGVIAIEASAPVRRATVERLLDVEDELEQI